MQINPGGRLNTQDVMGRDNEIARYWRVLERQGLVISAERRIGKTHILLKMRDECQSGYLPFYQDLEAVHIDRGPHPLDLQHRSTILEHVAQSQGLTSPSGPHCSQARLPASICRRRTGPGRFFFPKHSTTFSALPTTGAS